MPHSITHNDACPALFNKKWGIPGFWQQLYKGDLGQVRVGAQYEFVRLTAFPGSPIASATNGTAPNVGLNPYNNAVFFSLRYYPFN